MDIREVVRLVRAGESNSGIARALRLNRRTVIRYRAWATEQGLLEGGLPSTGELQRLVAEWWQDERGITIEIVGKQPNQHTFVVAPRRWVVETIQSQYH